MSQLTLFCVTEKPAPEIPEQWGKTLCQWKTDFADCDAEYQPLSYHILVRCREEMVTRNTGVKRQKLQGYVVEILYSIDEGDEPAELLVQNYKDFVQDEKKKAIREYSGFIIQVFQWRTIAESRQKTLKQTKDPDDCYECPFCGFMCFEWFETCIGCGKRFMRLDK